MGTKFNHLHVYLIGGGLLLLVGAGLWYFMIKPVNDQNAALRTEIQGLRDTQVQVDGRGYTIAQATQAKEALEAAKKRYAGKSADLARLEGRFQLPRGQRIDLGTGDRGYILNRTMRNWFYLPNRVLPTMVMHVLRSGARHRVSAVPSFGVPALTTDPDAIPKDIIAWNLGEITVRGRFTDVLRWAESYSRRERGIGPPYLTSIDGLKMSLADRQGIVTATCTCSIYLFPVGKATGVGAGGQGGGGAAQGGGGGGGYPGGPGGGGGGAAGSGFGGGNGGGGGPMRAGTGATAGR